MLGVNLKGMKANQKDVMEIEYIKERAYKTTAMFKGMHFSGKFLVI